jgi:hypothetical protein
VGNSNVCSVAVFSHPPSPLFARGRLSAHEIPRKDFNTKVTEPLSNPNESGFHRTDFYGLRDLRVNVFLEGSTVRGLC